MATPALLDIELDDATRLAGRRSTYALMDLLADYTDDIEDAFSSAIAAARALAEARGSINEEGVEAHFESAVLRLAERGIRGRQ